MSTVDYSQNDYHIKRHPELLESETLALAWACFAENAYFSGVQAGDSVLEFGGGLGSNLLSISRKADVWMVEPAPIGRERARAHGIKCVAGLEEIGDRTFDLILCRHVLEHVHGPLEVLQQLRPHLKPAGTIKIVVPVERMDQAPVIEELDHHLYCWNPRTLNNLLREAGYRVSEWHFEYYGARRKLLPVYKRFGASIYSRLVRLVGRIGRFRELVATATATWNQEITA